MDTVTYTTADGYYPTEEDWQAYRTPSANLITVETATEFSITYTHPSRTQESISVERFKVNGQWRILFRSAMALDFYESLGMYVERKEAIKEAKAFAARKGWN